MRVRGASDRVPGRFVRQILDGRFAVDARQKKPGQQPGATALERAGILPVESAEIGCEQGEEGLKVADVLAGVGGTRQKQWGGGVVLAKIIIKKRPKFFKFVFVI